MREAEDAGVRGGQAALYWNAAVIAERRGRVDEALHLCRRAMAHLSELEDSADLARVQVAAAVILLAADPPRTAEALAALERTHELVVHLGSMGDLAEWHWARSRVALLLNDLPVAREQAEAARRTLATRAEPGDLVLVGQVHLALADSLVAAGAPDDAVVELRRAREALSALPAGFATAYDLRALAERLADAGLEDLAREAFGLALDAAGVRDRDAAVRGAAQPQATNSRSRASTELAG
jgi:tetratricopeptide (TPR) repeat protein